MESSFAAVRELLWREVQWLDAASARFLIYLARRIDSLPALLVIAMRGAQMPNALSALVELGPIEVRVGP